VGGRAGQVGAGYELGGGSLDHLNGSQREPGGGARHQGSERVGPARHSDEGHADAGSAVRQVWDVASPTSALSGATADGGRTDIARRSEADSGDGAPSGHEATADVADSTRLTTDDDHEAAAGAGSAEARPDYETDTDGLGLADLLAGALAAYRGI
jgi:hypothetical protein